MNTLIHAARARPALQPRELTDVHSFVASLQPSGPPLRDGARWVIQGSAAAAAMNPAVNVELAIEDGVIRFLGPRPADRTKEYLGGVVDSVREHDDLIDRLADLERERPAGERAAWAQVRTLVERTRAKATGSALPGRFEAARPVYKHTHLLKPTRQHQSTQVVVTASHYDPFPVDIEVRQQGGKAFVRFTTALCEETVEVDVRQGGGAFRVDGQLNASGVLSRSGGQYSLSLQRLLADRGLLMGGLDVTFPAR